MHFLEKAAPISQKPDGELTFLYCGDTQCDGSGGYPECVRDHFRLYVILEGGGHFHLGDRSYDLAPGNVFLVCPGIPSSLKPVAGKTCSYFWIAFQGRQAGGILARAGLSKETPMRKGGGTRLLQNHYRKLVEACSSQIDGDLRTIAGLYEFFAALVSEAPQVRQGSGEPSQLARQAALWLEKNHARRITMGELVDLTGLNGKYFSRLFRKTHGVSPQKYLIDYRMERAKILLKNPNLSVSSVAYSVGYEDPLLFSRVFKKWKGRAPSYYRDTREIA